MTFSNRNSITFSLRKQAYTLVVCFLSMVGLSAQTTPGGLIAADAEPGVSANDIINDLGEFYPNEVVESPAYLYENLQVKKSPNKPKQARYRASPIDRNYYINNPFEIEDLSNPFNLPKAGRKKAMLSKNKNLENVGKFFQTLFAHSNTKGNSPQNIKQSMPLWVLFLLLGNLTFFAYLLRNYQLDIKKNLQGFLNPSSAAQQFREQKNSFNLVTVFSYLLFGLSMGSFIFLAKNILFSEPGHPAQWSVGFLAISTFGVLGLYVLRHLQLKLISFIFPFSHQLDYHSFLIANTNKIIGFFLAPLLFLCAYLPEAIQPGIFYSSLFALAIINTYRSGQSIVSSSEIILFHKVHFFIYLCTVEIAPVLILLKLLFII